jgi:HSP20 family protein
MPKKNTTYRLGVEPHIGVKSARGAAKPHTVTTEQEPVVMFNIDEQTSKIERLYRELSGQEPKRSDRPVAPIPPDANPEQYVQENLQRLEVALRGMVGASQDITVSTLTPRLAVFETEQEWRCVVEMPGVKKSDLSLQINQGVLRISAVRGLPGLTEQSSRPVYSELAPCRFERSLVIPPYVKFESVDARLENGILIVRCQKDPSALRRDVKVEVA